jgi:hypothetical protein
VCGDVTAAPLFMLVTKYFNPLVFPPGGTNMRICPMQEKCIASWRGTQFHTVA